MEYKLIPISQLDEISESMTVEYNELIKQLSRTPEPVAQSELEEVKRRRDSELLLCAFDGKKKLVGIVQGTYLFTPPNYTFYINSVVVNISERGQGLGKKILTTTIELAKKEWPLLKKVTLTNRPDRNNGDFYLKLGFEARDAVSGNLTTVYQLSVE